MNLNFKYNINKDIENYLIIHRVKYKGGDSKVLGLFAKKFSDNLTEDNLKKFIAGLVDFNKIDIDKVAENFGMTWQSVEQEFFERMNNIFKIDLPPENITAYLTTNDRCAYSINDDYFFVTVFTKNPKKIIAHELFHFYTYYAFEKEINALSEKDAYDIKESLTEILNLTCADLLESSDNGYVQHQELRKLSRSYWQENQDIRKVFTGLVENVNRR